jgi:uncharacterized protein involved in exopolysaccharide biosynthesis
MVENAPESASPVTPMGSVGNSGNLIVNAVAFAARHPRLVIGAPIIAGLMAVIVSLLLPKWYTATARILPPQQSQTNAVAILGQLGVFSGGASQALGLKNPSDVYVAMLRSRTIADKLIGRFDLGNVYDLTLLVDVRKELASNSRITAGRDGLIAIEVDDREPARAAAIANAYVDELRGMTLDLAVSEAAQRRLFFEGQLQKAKNDLVLAESALKRFTEDRGLVNPQGQIGLSVAAAASLRAQITAKEIQLSAMRAFATEDNPELRRSLRELAGLKGELAKLERESTEAKGDVLVPFGKAPEVGLEYVRKYRDVKYYETLYEVLAKQYEIARIDEAKDATLIQVLDRAIEPERKSRPRRALIVSLTVLFALAASVAVALGIDAHRKAAANPEYAASVEQLLKLLRSRKSP